MLSKIKSSLGASLLQGPARVDQNGFRAEPGLAPVKNGKSDGTGVQELDALKGVADTLIRENKQSHAAMTVALDALRETTIKETDAAVQEFMKGGQQATRLSDAIEAIGSETSGLASKIKSLSENSDRMLASSDSLSNVGERIGEKVEVSINLIEEHSQTYHATNSVVTELEEASRGIGEFVSLINDITARTRLLALNATIEAEHAGEAGRGFAVVALEVKTLAAQTSEATEKISAHVASMQKAVNEVVQKVSESRSTMQEVKSASDAIAETLNEQTNTIYDIESVIRFTDESAKDVATAFDTLTGNMDEACSLATDVQMQSMTMESDAEMLRGALSTAMTQTISALDRAFDIAKPTSQSVTMAYAGETITLELTGLADSHAELSLPQLDAMPSLAVGTPLVLQLDDVERHAAAFYSSGDTLTVRFTAAPDEGSEVGLDEEDVALSEAA